MKTDEPFFFENAVKVFNNLQDDESRRLFCIRDDYFRKKDLKALVRNIVSEYNDWRIGSREIWDHRNNLVIYGAGHDGEISLLVLRGLGIEPLCVCDTFKINADIYGVQIHNLEYVKEKYPDAFFVVCSRKYKDDIVKILMDNQIENARIHIPLYSYIYAARGQQYFDVFAPNKRELFVDAGGYDGITTKQFFEWANEDSEAIVLEPLPNMIDTISNTLKGYNFTLYNSAAWSKNETLVFTEEDTASHVNISPNNGMAVQAKTIDSIVGDKHITYIKMDIEGSELQALTGAIETIKRCHPRLAVCIYHKGGDYVELGAFILQIDSSYKFIIRHYSTNNWETVLYAY